MRTNTIVIGRGNSTVVVRAFELAVRSGHSFNFDCSEGYSRGNASYWTSGTKEEFIWHDGKLEKIVEWVTSTNSTEKESEVLTYDFAEAVKFLKKEGFEAAFDGGSWTTIDLSKWDNSWYEDFDAECKKADEANKMTAKKAEFALKKLGVKVISGQFNYVRENFERIETEQHGWVFYLENGVVCNLIQYENEKKYDDLIKRSEREITNLI